MLVDTKKTTSIFSLCLNKIVKEELNMGRPKGSFGKQPNKYWSKEAKYEYVKLILDGEISMRQLAKDNGLRRSMLWLWLKRYQEKGIEGLENKRKPGNPLSEFQSRKSLSPMEELQYENMKLRIENERLKKGYTTEEVMALRQRRSSKKNTKSSTD
jgi:transposase-like protein